MENCITEDMELEAQLKLALELPADRLLISAAGYNWDMNPEIVLSAIARRDDCSLLTALSIFYAGQPEYYERSGPKVSFKQALLGLYRRLRKSERQYYLPETNGRDILSLLLYIQHRVNTGGYHHDPGDHHQGLFNEPRELLLAPRRRRDGRQTIWHLDANIVRSALKSPEQKAADQNAMVLQAAKRHNKEVQSKDPFTREFSTMFEELFPEVPAVKAAKRLREEGSGKSQY